MNSGVVRVAVGAWTFLLAIDTEGRAVVAFPNLGDAYRELLRFGAGVEVLEPAELRDRVAATGREVAALYGM